MRLCNYTLSPTRINNAKPKGKLYKLTDGGGLFIEVSAAGLKTWRYQYRFGGVRREVTIGKFPEVGVADARDRHFELRALLERGVDPLDSRRQKLSEQKERAIEGKSAGNDFEAFSKRWVRERLTTKSETYRKQVESRLERFIWPANGTRALNAVRPADVLEIIEARRNTPKTAEGVRAIIRQIYKYAIQTLLAEVTDINLARFRGARPCQPTDELLGCPLDVHRALVARHHRSSLAPAQPAASCKGFPTRLDISTSVSIVDFEVFWLPHQTPAPATPSASEAHWPDATDAR